MAARKKGKRSKRGKKTKKGKRKGNPAFKKPVTVDDELFNIIKVRKCSRGLIVKKVWTYIKSKKLQDPDDGRFILPDKKLGKLFGAKRRTNMMKLAGIINKHIKSK